MTRREEMVQYVEAQLLTGELQDYSVTRVGRDWLMLNDDKGRVRALVAVYVTIEDEE